MLPSFFISTFFSPIGIVGVSFLLEFSFIMGTLASSPFSSFILLSYHINNFIRLQGSGWVFMVLLETLFLF